MKGRVLIIDDDVTYLHSMAELLSIRDYKAYTSPNGNNVLQLIDEHDIDILLLDLSIPGKDGMQILDEVASARDDIPVIMISGQGEIRHAVEAIKKGALDFIEKGEPVDKVFRVMENALRKREFLAQKKKTLKEVHFQSPFLGDSYATRALNNTIEQVARSNMDVLILGESGTGKELVARQIHNLSARKEHPFLAVNCANFNPNLIESELFGHTRGAFTGADQNRKGKIFASDQGTLFLDEIGELPVSLQGKFLRVLETREATPLGENKPIQSDFRLIAATNRDLKKMVDMGKFREDLYYRIADYVIKIPPLRERKEDIIPIFLFYLQEFSEKYKGRLPRISPEIENMLLQYSWPGNVRELKSFAENVIVFHEADLITRASLQDILRGPLQHHPIANFLSDF
jgi:DNA-binding NtrC family response regulator